MNLYELFKKFETEFLAGHEKIKTELDFELFVGKLSEQILGDVYSLDTVYKTGGNHIEVTAVGYGYSFEVEYHITKLVTCINSKYWLLATFTNYLKMHISIAY